MLVLTRKSGETIRIGDNIRVVVVEVKDNHVKLGIDAPQDCTIHREEIYLKIQEDNIRASSLPKDVADALKGTGKR
ncbi:MAG: carbon storage regulator CsrA [Thermodesulfobacteriota bacterium]|nr:MAG: carbon storage regulator CsrA [Thermodesulfobacteriota bacterium]